MAPRRWSRLDSYDLRILAALQRDGRISMPKLAREVHLSRTPCWERVQRLEAQGIIHHYATEIDIDRLLDLSKVVVEVTLKSHQAEDFERFEAMVRACPEIVECYAVAGDLDYLLTLRASLSDCQRLIEGFLAVDKTIERYLTYIVTRPVKHSAGPPLEYLLKGR